MATANLQTDVPLVNVPLVNADGTVTESWFIFLVQLFRRTGGTSGGDGGITLADVLSLEATFAPPTMDPNGDVFANERDFPRLEAEKQLLDMIFAPVATQMVNESFASGTNFTPGTTTALTLKESFSSAAQLLVFFDGTFQGDDQYSLSGVTLTFTGAIPLGTSKVYVKGLR